MVDFLVVDGGEIPVFWEVLADEAVGVFVAAALPGSERSGKEEVGVQCGADVFVIGELGTVVGGQGMYPGAVGREQGNDGLADGVSGFALHLVNQRQSGFALG